MRAKPMDSIELEFFRQMLTSIPEEMGAVLRKTAFSPNIKERRDYSCALYDGRGETLAMGDHMPVHLGAMPASVAHAIAGAPLGPGDVVVLNDPFRGGTHLPDITAVSGVYLGRERPAFYVATRAHHSDVGGMSPGSMPLAREIYQEGLRLPPVRLVRGGQVDEEMLSLILANVRTPEEREGDLRAQLAAMARGEARLRELTGRYGLERVESLAVALTDYSERMMRAALGSVPRGRYEFEDVLDDDGVGGGEVQIRVAVTIEGDRAEIDFTGSSGQREGPVNANLAVATSAVFYVFRCLLREEVPATGGLLRPLRIIAPEGSVVNARPPAAMAAGNVETSQRITDVLLGALAQAIPERIPAASSGTMSNVSLGGWDERRGRRFAWYETIAGGMGASAAHAGQSGVHTHMTNSWNTPVEAFEHDYPLRVRQYRVRRGSGGEGRHAGGDGLVREFEFLAGAEVTLLADRRITAPFGLEGGGGGRRGRAIHTRGGERREVPGKCTLRVEAGDGLVIETPGGGGFGLK
ncbi:MAG: hydantoinase B/oxoprolinase family protein [Bryobacteraceae bacterium]|nr:hydantoinase B/oxoprolinase family protein [Bryobacteraceae bacterium]